MFGWFTTLRRRRVTSAAFPQQWERIIADNVRHFEFLNAEQQNRVRRIVQVFVSEKNWEGCGGLNMTDEVRVSVSALVGVLVAGMTPDEYFDHVLSILVYPTSYVAPHREVTHSGIVIEGGQARLGEAWWRGPVILSWEDVIAGGQRDADGGNLVFHEFAHQLDMLNGREVDGTPPLADRRQFDRWLAVLGPAYEQLVADCRRGRHRFLDCYGAKDPAEFFAVLTEAFFERGDSLRHLHPEIYAVLQDYFGLDPAAW